MIALQLSGSRLTVQVRSDSVCTVGAIMFVLAGATLRLSGLAALPLQPHESDQALDALRLHRGELAEYMGAPLATNLQALAFFLFGDTEASARLVGVLAGLGLSALPLMVRGIDPLWRMSAVAVLVFSSLAVFLAREAVVGSVSALLVGTAAVAGWNYLLERDRRALLTFSASCGLAVAASSAAVTSGLIGLLLLTAYPSFDRSAERLFRVDPRSLPFTIAIGLLSFVLGSTLVGLSPSGLQAGLGSIWSWPGDFRFLDPARLLGIALDDPLLTVCVMAGAVLTLRDRSRPRLLLLAWAVGQLALVVVAGAPDLRYLSLSLFPLALVGGIAVANVVRRARTVFTAWPLLTAALALVPLGFMFMSGQRSASDATELPFAVGLFGVAALLLVLLYAATSRPRREVWSALILVALALVALAQIRGVATLNSWEPEPGRSLLRTTVALPTVRLAERTVALWDAEEGRGVIAVDDQLHGLLAWPLRRSAKVTFGPLPRPATGRTIALAPGPADREPDERYVRLPITVTLNPQPRITSPATFWRWFVAADELHGASVRAILLVP